MKKCQNPVLVYKTLFFNAQLTILFFLAFMYNQYLNSASYYDNYTSSKTTKNISQSRFEHTYPIERTKDVRSYQWNIEESKENSLFRKDRPVTASYQQYPRTEFNGYSTTDYNCKKDWEKSNNDFGRAKNSKSSKNLKFADVVDKEYENRNLNTTFDDYKSEFKKKKENLKSITQSLGSNAKLKDLLPNFKNEDYSEYRKHDSNEKSMKSLKACRSETRIKMNLDENVLESRKQIRDVPKSPNNNKIIKSYKQIAEYLNEGKFAKKQQKQIPVFGSSYSKTSKYITEDLTFRPKLEKTTTYTDHPKQELDLSRFKKHNTVDMARSPPEMKPKQRSQRGKLSIHDFELGKCKGEGAFGQVFPAIHKETKMLVAIKKVPKEKVKYMLDQFINQIKIQLYVDHPNVVKLYGFFDDSTHFYIIMEYMEGGSLYNLIKKQKNLSENDTIEKLKDICLGLKQMHDNSILHRDIKPQNIVLTHNVCKLCDLGWAAICKDRRTTYCGTLDYVSPQIIGGEGYDDSVDIWCIGVLAYEMICGKTPFYNISRKQTMKKIVDVNYEYPAQLTPKSKAFIDKILKKNPTERISIDEVLKDTFLQ